MRLSFLKRSKSPTSPTTSTFSGGSDFNLCDILLVDSLYLAGAYHLTPYNSPQPSPTRNESKDNFESSSYDPLRNIDSETHECQRTTELVQHLLETYKQVTTVTTGNVAMSFLHDLPIDHVGHTILLIDLDSHTSNGQHTNSDLEHENRVPHDIKSNSDILYGLELLKVVVTELELGVISNVVPIVLSCNDSPQLMWSCLDLGAVDYLVKPVSPQAIKTLWLNISRAKRPEPLRDTDDEPTLVAARVALGPTNNRDAEEEPRGALTRDTWLEEVIVNHYAPPYHHVDISSFPQLNSASDQERVLSLRRMLSSWEFCPYDLSEEDLLRCILIILQDSLVIKGLKNIDTSTEVLHRFILYVRISYNDLNPYHNFYHAVDVLQATYYMLKKLGLIGHPNGNSSYSPHLPGGKKRVQNFIRPNDVFALIIATLAHDLGHPGVNNSYMINAHSSLALLYNDEAVLENFHAMYLFLLMKKHGVEFFAEQSSPEAQDFRKLVISIILATDMSAHFDYIHNFVEQNARLNSQAALDPETERMAFSAAIIKCADISNSARPYHISERWTDNLIHEFSNQALLETTNGYPLIMNPHQSKRDSAQGQIDFIEKLSLPLFNVVTETIPEFSFCLHIIHDNIAEWERVRDMCPSNTSNSKTSRDNGK
ncbi:3',5'-cyclic-nucleotide phosphodiesterase [Basidiobolus ranarum]|uniref:Phosphodiesterase n=1 Tax=Basidiobolus ranarum TaxID=34480 RepID=A0ABR2WFH1_9FUNG